MARRGNDLVDLVAGEFASLAGLGSLRDLDLQLIGIREVPTRHAETARRDLLDRGALRVAVRFGLEAFVVLAPFAGVTLAADAVHGDGERLVSLGRDRPIAHRAGAESFDNRLHRIDLRERYGRQSGLELKHS